MLCTPNAAVDTHMQIDTRVIVEAIGNIQKCLITYSVVKDLFGVHAVANVEVFTIRAFDGHSRQRGGD